jgi:hypothetical protein
VSLRLPVDVYSVEQLSSLIAELREHASAVRSATVRAKVSERRQEVPAPSPLLTSLLHGTTTKVDDATASEALLKDLETLRKKAPIAHITLAALPTRTIKRQLVVWFRAEIHPYALLTFAMRSDIGGGLILQVGSHIYDLSFRQQLLANKQRISEIFASV